MARGERGHLASKSPITPVNLSPVSTPTIESSVSPLAINRDPLAIPPQPDGVPITRVSLSSSYASLIDPDDGTSLYFVPATLVNRKKCAKLDQDDVSLEIDYWNNVVICSLLGANPPLSIMEGYIRFMQLQDKLTVGKRGIYFFDSKLFIVKGWNPKMDLRTESIESLPTWGLASLSKIGSILGIPIKTDKFTKEKGMLKFARLLIKMSLEGPFPEWIEFINDNDILIRQEVSYEWLPIKCTYCHIPGHEVNACRKKETVHKTNDINVTNAIRSTPQTQPQLDSEGFIPVARKGLNWPNKREDVKSFLVRQNAGMVGLLETKVKDFCDMWSSHKTFSHIIALHLPGRKIGSSLAQSNKLLRDLHLELRKLNQDHFAYLNEQQVKAKDALEQDQEAKCRAHYIGILTSIMSLAKQQCKLDWISYGDDCTKFFFVKAKQQKLATYIYTIQDAGDNQVEGFDQVGEVILPFYKQLLGKQTTTRSCIDRTVINVGSILSFEQ
ncbi:hypothetical protein Cgig2_007978 [Carnegiea gigantea]|uniref:DUF4283 domain-containing protein n=1 Tax=Carnegiea gigantea TaxID=171969 RepID=A0A9Q1GJH3_9CARY|nr:hypothetical protein Cgig2_007978 [Carnegiea gigantea]